MVGKYAVEPSCHTKYYEVPDPDAQDTGEQIYDNESPEGLEPKTKSAQSNCYRYTCYCQISSIRCSC